MAMDIREANKKDLEDLMGLYLYLHESDGNVDGNRLHSVWEQIASDRNYHILVGEADGRIVSSVSVIIIQNLTRSASPYAIIENVITHPDYRNNGYASALMQRAVAYAGKAGCYKTYLTTGSKDPHTLRFYENNGFNPKDKTAFILWNNDVKR